MPTVTITPKQLALFKKALDMARDAPELGEITRIGNSIVELEVNDEVRPRLVEMVGHLMQMVGFDEDERITEDGKLLQDLLGKL
jgi:hypothetical protein